VRPPLRAPRTPNGDDEEVVVQPTTVGPRNVVGGRSLKYEVEQLHERRQRDEVSEVVKISSRWRAALRELMGCLPRC